MSEIVRSKIYEAEGYPRVLDDVGVWTSACNAAYLEAPPVRGKKRSFSKIFPLPRFCDADLSMKIRLKLANRWMGRETVQSVGQPFYTECELNLRRREHRSIYEVGCFAMAGGGDRFRIPHRIVECEKSLGNLGMDYRRLGLATASFDVLEEIAKIMDGKRIQMRLVVGGTILEGSFENVRMAVQADVLSLALCRGYEPAEKFSHRTVCEIVNGDFEVAMDVLGALKAFPKDERRLREPLRCEVVKVL